MINRPTKEEIEKDFRAKVTAKFKGQKLTEELQKEIEEFIHIYLIEIDILYGTGKHEPLGFLKDKK